MRVLHVQQGGLGDTREIRPALDLAWADESVGMILVHGGLYPERVSTYEHPIRGGSSTTSRFVIRPYRRERVVLRPVGGDFVLHLAHPEASWVEIGSSDVDMEFDGTQLDVGGGGDAIKITYTSAAPTGAQHVRIRRARAYGSPHTGILNNVRWTEFLGGASFSNGFDPDPGDANKDHGVYLAAGSFDCRVVGVDTWDNAAYGVTEYGSEVIGRVGRNLIEGGRHTNNGRLALRSGVQLGGVGSKARQLVCTGNQFGVHVYKTARDCDFRDCYLEGNVDGRWFIDPAAQGTTQSGNEWG